MSSDLRHQAHVQEVEKKIKLLQMNWFLKNHEEAKEKPGNPKSAQTTRLIDEILEMREEIKGINAKLDEYQKELNATESDGRSIVDGDGGQRPEETEIAYMYPVPSDVKRLLYTGVSKTDEGKYLYLKMRKTLSPDEKYRACPTHNFAFGWNHKQQPAPVGPKHSTTEALRRAMDSVHGITLYHKHPTQRPPNSHW